MSHLKNLDIRTILVAGLSPCRLGLSSQTSLCGTCGVKTRTGTGFSSSTSVSHLCCYTIITTHSYFIHQPPMLYNPTTSFNKTLLSLSSLSFFLCLSWIFSKASVKEFSVEQVSGQLHLFSVLRKNLCKELPLYRNILESCWNVMAHDDAVEGKWRGNWRMEWVASTFHTTSEHGVSSITTADVHNSAASSRLHWRPSRFKWTRPFRRKTKSGLCACAITFESQSAIFSSYLKVLFSWSFPNKKISICDFSAPYEQYTVHL
jgi:hypothetical protein